MDPLVVTGSVSKKVHRFLIYQTIFAKTEVFPYEVLELAEIVNNHRHGILLFVGILLSVATSGRSEASFEIHPLIKPAGWMEEQRNEKNTEHQVDHRRKGEGIDVEQQELEHQESNAGHKAQDVAPFLVVGDPESTHAPKQHD